MSLFPQYKHLSNELIRKYIFSQLSPIEKLGISCHNAEEMPENSLSCLLERFVFEKDSTIFKNIKILFEDILNFSVHKVDLYTVNYEEYIRSVAHTRIPRISMSSTPTLMIEPEILTWEAVVIYKGKNPMLLVYCKPSDLIATNTKALRFP